MEKATTKRFGKFKAALMVLFASVLLFIGAAFVQAPEKAYAAAKPSCYMAEIKVANYGTIVVSLDRKAAPITVDNFVSLARSGAYTNSSFHRIEKNFVIQGGRYKGQASTGKDKTIKGEFSLNGWKNPISHKRGTISMARTDKDYNSASREFFIVHQDYTEVTDSKGKTTKVSNAKTLDGKYAAFGNVVSGMDVVDKICDNALVFNGQLLTGAPVISSVKVTASPSGSGWKKVGNKWRYYYEAAMKSEVGNKKYPKSEKVLIGGKWYRFDSQGFMMTGWKKIGGKKYYFGTDGVMRTDWAKIGNKTYLFDSNGVMLTGTQVKDGNTYYLDTKTGARYSGWKTIKKKRYFFDNDGVMANGTILFLNNAIYMFDYDGSMKTGWAKDIPVENTHYSFYFDSKNGKMKTGWQKISGKWYYLGGKYNSLVTNKWIGEYWLGADGVMATNSWVDNNRYYVDKNGKKVKSKKPSAALTKATALLKKKDYSYKALVEKLKEYKYSPSAAVKAAADCGANWNTQALNRATTLLKSTTYSKKALINKLKAEKFTQAQANYAAKNCKADWATQALTKAKALVKANKKITKDQLVKKLTNAGFTSSEAKTAATKALSS